VALKARVEEIKALSAHADYHESASSSGIWTWTSCARCSCSWGSIRNEASSVVPLVPGGTRSRDRGEGSGIPTLLRNRHCTARTENISLDAFREKEYQETVRAFLPLREKSKAVAARQAEKEG
jgi:hypothetical protein